MALARDLQVTAQNPLLRLVVASGSSMNEEIHRFIHAFCRSRYRTSIAERFGTAGYELFVNALEYGTISRPVVMELREQAGQIELSVNNEAIPARLRMLEERLKVIRRDPKSAYLEEMRRSVNGGYPRAMLGLVRIAHEVGLLPQLKVDQPRITVSVSCPL